MRERERERERKRERERGESMCIITCVNLSGLIVYLKLLTAMMDFFSSSSLSSTCCGCLQKEQSSDSTNHYLSTSKWDYLRNEGVVLVILVDDVIQ